jgi:Recombinase
VPGRAATGAYRPTAGPETGAATVARRVAAERAAHRLLLEVDRLRDAGVTSMQALARCLTERGVPTPQGSATWTHTTVGRLLTRTGTQTVHEFRKTPFMSPVFQAEAILR